MHLLGLFLVCTLSHLASTEYISYDELYEDGMETYWNNNWKGAIYYFEQAIESYKKYKTGVISCYKKCKVASSEDESIIQSRVGRISLTASCSRECLDEKFGDSRIITRVSPAVKQLFENLKPYAYLQFAYFKENELAKSVAAAYTGYLRFPEDGLMKANMEFYRGKEEVTEEMYVNLEPRPHMEKYDLGVQAYLREDYTSATEHLEESLTAYFEEVEICSALCEGEHEFREDPEDDDGGAFFRKNADHYIQVLECSLKCVRDLGNETGKLIQDFLPIHYHYLMFGYDQLGNFEKAVECGKTFMVFHPTHQLMKENLQFYTKQRNISEFEARKDATLFHKRISAMSALLKYSYSNFGIKDFDPGLLDLFPDLPSSDDAEQQENGVVQDENREEDNNIVEVAEELESQEDEGYSSMKEKTDDIITNKGYEVEKKMAEQEKKQRDEQNYAEPEDDVDISDLLLSTAPGHETVDSKHMIVIDEKLEGDSLAEGPIMFPGTVLLANSSQLKGRNRFAVDQFATEDDCVSLIDLELSFGQQGDGYGGKESPHTVHERFEGVTLLKASRMAKQGALPLSAAQLYYDLSEKVRAQVQSYFKLPELYFDYTHLVCRTALPNSPVSRSDMSHPVHADNCLLKNNGSCLKERPAYTWRDYSSILYLNSDFEGGEFFFTDSTSKRVRTMLKPKCGRLVSFGAGPECYHGVKPILSGQRCALALWFTMSKSKDERQRIEAKRTLDELAAKQKDEL